ncbi:zinc finger protein ZAT9-like [Bidens hawaiensis]|uniref:zinc finger protein ZAT9-like n=1 Tax=Bidens hawaiensis TaxID=980011 RepID=UPI00404B62DD
MDEACYYELRFVCKLCDKRFPSGKSLGGHMRSHVVATASASAVAGAGGAGVGAGANSDESDDKFNENDKNLNTYVLRENPRKSWRASSSNAKTLPSPNAKTCKQCGKKFQSLKALCGHMAFHSEKDKGLKAYDDDSWTSDDNNNNNSYFDTDENEVQDPVFGTRSKSRMCKKVVVKVKPCSLSLTNTNSTTSNYNYGSSSVSEIDEFEQEDVAMCLMKLSKDSGNWVGVNSVGESSDNASVDLETKKSSLEMNIKKKLDLSYEEKQEIRRNLFREFGYDSTLTKRIRDNNDDDGGGLYKKKNKYECLNCNKTFSSFQGLGGHRPCHKKNNGFTASEYARDQKGKTEKKVPKKNKWHECPICFRMFKSGQALGGHKRSHFMNGYEDRIDDMAAMEQAAATATYTDMFDLNLPAPEED